MGYTFRDMGNILVCLGLQAAQEAGDEIVRKTFKRMNPRGRSLTRRPKGLQYIGPQARERENPIETGGTVMNFIERN